MPQTDTGILLIVGAIFLLIGLLGGGIEIAAARIPSIGKYPRIFSGGIGVILMGIALIRFIFPSFPPPPTTIAAITETPVSKSTVDESTETPTLTKTPIPQPIPTATLIPWVRDKLVYEEDFEDGIANGWEGTGFEVIQLSDDNHVWRTKDGYSTLTLPIETANYAFEVKTVQASGNGGLGMMGIRNESGYPCDAQYLSYTDTALDWLTLVQKDFSCDESRRDEALFGAYKVELLNEVWYTRRLEAKGSEVRLYLDGVLVIFDEGGTLKSNRINLGGCCEDTTHEFYFDDIRVWSID